MFRRERGALRMHCVKPAHSVICSPPQLLSQKALTWRSTRQSVRTQHKEMHKISVEMIAENTVSNRLLYLGVKKLKILDG